MPLFMQIAGIPGDAREAQHVDWIELNSFAFGRPRDSQPTVRIRSVVISKASDRSSAGLAEATMTGRKFSRVVIDQVGEKKTRRFTLDGVMIVSSSSDNAGEQYNLGFEAVAWDEFGDGLEPCPGSVARGHGAAMSANTFDDPSAEDDLPFPEEIDVDASTGESADEPLDVEA